MAPTYPQRNQYFAHKLIRLMFRVCAVQDIGADAFLLVTLIAHTEDAKRYSGPVTFWNEQLMSILGAGSWGKLDRARKKATEAGWLYYEGGGKGRVGKYWATVPTQFLNLDDAPTDCDAPVSLSTSGETTGETNIYLSTSGEQSGEQNGFVSPPAVNKVEKEKFVPPPVEKEPGDNRGTTGEHSTLYLNLKRKGLPDPTHSQRGNPEFVDAWISFIEFHNSVNPSGANVIKLRDALAELTRTERATGSLAKPIADLRASVRYGGKGNLIDSDRFSPTNGQTATAQKRPPDPKADAQKIKRATMRRMRGQPDDAIREEIRRRLGAVGIDPDILEE